MEALSKECPHPDDKQRLRLSQELGLKPCQVKFWFQNRRTQMKAQKDRGAENDSLKNENYRLQAAIHVICPSCGGPVILGEMSFDEHHPRIENARLKEDSQNKPRNNVFSSKGKVPPFPSLKKADEKCVLTILQ
ncbi:homeobox-leucine zipper protein ROC3-like [Phalaenopsis equestris]|uniref:homeobox-leucine zipper protein ROC3-like n=1 Tax=Phalaenopsis equestris TaxID=78828 RepID=UPI0009E29D0F|nr:homeobox-leucine zipper protein ROC3-like [Phalaenopsis equestris]